MELVIIRRVVLGVLFLGMAGALGELTLMGHYQDATQKIPIVVIAAGFLSLALQRAHPQTWTIGLVSVTMALFIIAGVLGMYFHYRGSMEFQLEMDPAMRGTDLMWHVLRAKSPPTLSPGTMVQMGILGLGYAYLKKRERR